MAINIIPMKSSNSPKTCNHSVNDYDENKHKDNDNGENNNNNNNSSNRKDCANASNINSCGDGQQQQQQDEQYRCPKKTRGTTDEADDVSLEPPNHGDQKLTDGISAFMDEPRLNDKTENQAEENPQNKEDALANEQQIQDKQETKENKQQDIQMVGSKRTSRRKAKIKTPTKNENISTGKTKQKATANVKKRKNVKASGKEDIPNTIEICPSQPDADAITNARSEEMNETLASKECTTTRQQFKQTNMETEKAKKKPRSKKRHKRTSKIASDHTDQKATTNVSGHQNSDMLDVKRIQKYKAVENHGTNRCRAPAVATDKQEVKAVPDLSRAPAMENDTHNEVNAKPKQRRGRNRHRKGGAYRVKHGWIHATAEASDDEDDNEEDRPGAYRVSRTGVQSTADANDNEQDYINARQVSMGDIEAAGMEMSSSSFEDAATGTTASYTFNEEPIIAEIVPDEDHITQEVAERLEAALAKQIKRQVSKGLRAERQGHVEDEAVQEEDLKPKNTDGRTQHHSSRKWLPFFVCLIGMVVFVIIFVIRRVRGDTNSEGNSAPPTNTTTHPPTATMPPTKERFEELFKILQPYIFMVNDGISEIDVTRDHLFTADNLTTPQFEALFWLAYTDEANVNVAIGMEQENFETDDSLNNDFLSLHMLIERFALAVFFFATDGSNWSKSFGFLGSTSVCDWNNEFNETGVGVFCSGDDMTKDRSVTQIALVENEIAGTIPTELALLSNLKILDLSHNGFYGSLPSEIFGLSSMEAISFRDNALFGKLSKDISQMSNLKYLNVAENDFYGTIPIELFFLHETMEFLFLYSNSFTGTIPTQLGYLRKLKRFVLGECYLTGGIPTHFGELTNLRYLYLEENSLTGTIPSELGLLTHIDSLYLFSNPLTGTVPIELSALTSLHTIFVADTLLTGDLDPVFCDNRLHFNNDTNSMEIVPYEFFLADCLHEATTEEISCSCCTHCCNRSTCLQMTTEVR